jgi:hypothetical protein
MSEQSSINTMLSALLKLNAIIDRVSYTMSAHDGAALEYVRKSVSQLQLFKKLCEEPSREGIMKELDLTMENYFKLFDVMESIVFELRDDSEGQKIVLECLVEMILGLRTINFTHDDYKEISARVSLFNEKALALAREEFGKKK